MKRNITVQLKAAFLLVVFSLNMVIGFACAIGIDMWFNSNHHGEIKITGHEGTHHQDEQDVNHKSNGCNDNCCNDHVIKFSKVDKSLPQCFAGINGIFFTALISTFYNIDVLQTSKGSANVKFFVRSYHPPIPDIRIAIQSFQI